MTKKGPMMDDKKHPLEVWIERSDYSVSQLAELLDVSRQTIYNWMAGSCYPTVRHLMDLHNLSGGVISLADFAPVPKCVVG